MSRSDHLRVPGAEPHGERIKVPIYFHPDVFEIVRKRAVREGSTFGEVVAELVEGGLGG